MAPVSRYKTGPRPAITVYRIYMVLYGTYFYKPTSARTSARERAPHPTAPRAVHGPSAVARAERRSRCLFGISVGASSMSSPRPREEGTNQQAQAFRASFRRLAVAPPTSPYAARAGRLCDR